jgi:flavin reductase ActVB
VKTAEQVPAGASAATARFKEAMSCWASGVTVVTTTGPDGARHGFTASAFSAVSLHPPIVLVCLDRAARCRPAFARSEWIAVHVLGRDQEQLAQRFAGPAQDKFAGLATTPGRGGAPLLAGPLARLECRIADREQVGDHLVLFAEVHGTEAAASVPRPATPFCTSPGPSSPWADLRPPRPRRPQAEAGGMADPAGLPSSAAHAGAAARGTRRKPSYNRPINKHIDASVHL